MFAIYRKVDKFKITSPFAWFDAREEAADYCKYLTSLGADTYIAEMTNVSVMSFGKIAKTESKNKEIKNDYSHRIKMVSKEHELTNREQELFELLAYGRNAKYIERKLMISENTVKSHIRNIYSKLGVTSKQEMLNKVEDSDSDSSKKYLGQTILVESN